MNERIFELALRAKLHGPLVLQHWGKINALTDSEQEELENIEKFAELIIKSCATVGDFAHRGGVVEPGVMIKEYFGVE